MDRTQDRVDIVKGVGMRLVRVERSVDNTFVQLAALAAELPTARQEAGMALQVGAEAATTFATALAQLGQVRETIAKGHKQLAVVQRKMGDHQDIGGGDKGDNQAALDRALA